MVSYSRLRPAMSRADPRRCCFETAPVGAGAGGVAPPRGGSVPVVLMWSPFGREARVATDKEGGASKGAYLTRNPPAVSPGFSGFWLAVEPVHGRGQAVADDGFHGVGGAADQVGQRGSLGAREVRQDVVGRVAARRRPADADADAREPRVAQRRDDRPDAVVAAGAAAAAELQAVERHVQLVVHDDRVAETNLPEAGDARDRLPADVHELHRPAQQDALALDGRLGDLRAKLLARRRGASAARQLLGDHEPQVVPVVRVLPAGIPEADDQVHAGTPSPWFSPRGDSDAARPASALLLLAALLFLAAGSRGRRAGGRAGRRARSRAGRSRAFGRDRTLDGRRRDLFDLLRL